jgi:hypothetical protein
MRIDSGKLRLLLKLKRGAGLSGSRRQANIKQIVCHQRAAQYLGQNFLIATIGNYNNMDLWRENQTSHAVAAYAF